jgi:hypothetical protein
VFTAFSQGTVSRDPFRRGLGYAVQWYDSLKVRVERSVDHATEEADGRIQARKSGDRVTENENNDRITVMGDRFTASPMAFQEQETHSRGTRPSSSLSQEQCARILQQLCPACFGGVSFGESFNR